MEILNVPVQLPDFRRGPRGLEDERRADQETRQKKKGRARTRRMRRAFGGDVSAHCESISSRVMAQPGGAPMRYSRPFQRIRPITMPWSNPSWTVPSISG